MVASASAVAVAVWSNDSWETVVDGDDSVGGGVVWVVIESVEVHPTID